MEELVKEFLDKCLERNNGDEHQLYDWCVWMLSQPVVGVGYTMVLPKVIKYIETGSCGDSEDSVDK
jgi:hypothetical protein